LAEVENPAEAERLMTIALEAAMIELTPSDVAH
jgi:hypothetical protein